MTVRYAKLKSKFHGGLVTYMRYITSIENANQDFLTGRSRFDCREIRCCILSAQQRAEEGKNNVGYMLQEFIEYI